MSLRCTLTRALAFAIRYHSLSAVVPACVFELVVGPACPDFIVAAIMTDSTTALASAARRAGYAGCMVSLAKHVSHVSVSSHSLTLQFRLHCRHMAEILNVDGYRKQIYIHYVQYSDKFDEWLNIGMPCAVDSLPWMPVPFFGCRIVVHLVCGV